MHNHMPVAESFEKEYQTLQGFATSCLRQTGLHDQDADEVLSEAYLRIYDKPYSMDECRRVIASIVTGKRYEQQKKKRMYNTLSDCAGKGGKSGFYEKRCCTCKKELPVSAFYFLAPRGCYSSSCRECKKAKMRFDSKEMDRKRRERLTDTYLINLLLRTKKYKGFDRGYFKHSPGILMDYRQRIEQRRLIRAENPAVPIGKWTNLQEYVRVYRSLHKDRLNEYQRKRHAEKKDQLNAQARLRYAKKKALKAA